MPLPPKWTQLRYHPLQTKLWRTTAKRVAVLAGRGSGKTEIARRYVVRMLPVKKPWTDPMYFYALPTREQAKRIAWPALKALVPPEWLACDPSESELVIKTIFGSSLHLVGMDKPQRIEGNQWDGGIMDESCDQKPRAFALSVQPALQHRDGFYWGIGVTKRFGIGAQEFLERYDQYASGELGPGHEAYTWPSTDILPPHKIAAAMRELDPKDFAEQYLAQRQEIGGRIFYAFDRVKNVSADACYRPGVPIVVGSDFNVNPMAWSLMHVVNGDVDVFDEMWIRNTNTQATLDELFKRYGDHKSGFIFIGDATARSRNTRASSSDYAQIMNDTRFDQAQVHYPKSNPSHVNRFASCNRMFCDATGKRRVRVNPRCKRLINDLNERGYKENSREPDDSHPDRGHMSDAFGYPIHYLFPVLAVEDGEEQIMVQAGV